MNIIDSDVIKNDKKKLIGVVKNGLDPNAVKNILKKRMAAAAPSSRGGKIIVHNNKIAFKLDFDIQLKGNLMFDRQGNHIPESDKTSDEKPDLEHGDHDKSEDGDISDILEESREFWEPEKKS